MSYTIGIKRKFWPGYRKVSVNGHDWQNGRFILNLVDGAQEHVPGYSVRVLKVFPDFWTHIAREKRQGATVEPRPVPAQAKPVDDFELIRQQEPIREEPVRQEPKRATMSPMEQEIARRAQEKVDQLFSSGNYQEN
jgi:hypothetical protein